MSTPAELEAEVIRLTNEAVVLNNTISGLTEELSALDAVNAARGNEILALQGELQASNMSRDNLQVLLDRCQTDLALANEIVSGLPQDVINLNKKFDHMIVMLDEELLIRRKVVSGKLDPSYIDDVSFQRNEINRLTGVISDLVSKQASNFNPDTA